MQLGLFYHIVLCFVCSKGPRGNSGQIHTSYSCAVPPLPVLQFVLSDISAVSSSVFPVFSSASAWLASCFRASFFSVSRPSVGEDTEGAAEGRLSPEGKGREKEFEEARKPGRRSVMCYHWKLRKTTYTWRHWSR